MHEILYKILSLDIDRGDNYEKKIMISCLFIVLFALDFSQKIIIHYLVSVDFALKVVKWSDNQTIKLQLWDIAGIAIEQAARAKKSL